MDYFGLLSILLGLESCVSLDLCLNHLLIANLISC